MIILKANKIDYLFILFGLLGLGAMIYSYLSFGLDVVSRNSCTINSVISCSSVETSIYSTFLGIKLYYYGMAYFSAIIVLSLLVVKEIRINITGYLISLLSIIASIISVYLIYTEIFLLGHICILCTLAHVSIFSLLILSVIKFKFI
ncbi:MULTISPECIES: vitamin K epoxide reductase family protein [Sulfolobaceae]|uniref:vitamin K epoxide reductase family protein n=1 Tax=Sulfolobaceae TaxID=118883 RepID=UPI001F05F2FC|nr:vitamin K epoxide reductase family protein [Metallosphaera sedula]MCH4816811.1 vitamin K epoxide reductase family protein [Saccharolobus shibatae]